MDEQNVDYPYNVILFSHKEKWSTDTHYEFKNITVSERSQINKGHIVYESIYLKMSRIGKPTETESRLAGAGGKQRMGSDCLWGDEKVLELASGDSFTTLWIYLTTTELYIFLFIYFCGAVHWIQGLKQVRQVLYH